jgi:HEAT repeat protein
VISVQLEIDYNIFRNKEAHMNNDEIKSLVETLDSEDYSVHEAARYTLIQLGSPAVPDLLEMLKSEKDHTRWEVVKTLAGIKDPASAPALVELLIDDSIEVHWAASEALIGLGGKAIVPLLQGITRHFDSYRFRQGAYHVMHTLESLHALDPESQKVLESLRSLEPGVSAPWAAQAALEILKGNQK